MGVARRGEGGKGEGARGANIVRGSATWQDCVNFHLFGKNVI